MDFAQVAKYFDRQNFDVYNFTTAAWQLNVFKGQIKLADTFVSIWNRPTRKRMLYCSPGSTPTGSVIRLSNTGEIFLVGTGQGDTHANTHYRQVYGLHRTAGTAQHNRKTPTVTLGVKGWAVDALIQNTFADVELRSVNEGQKTELTNYGHYFMFLPSDSTVQRHDTIVLNGSTYFVLETYPDSGYKGCRVTISPDERIDFVYVSKGAQSYNTATQTVSSIDTSYHVTGRVTPVAAEDMQNTEIQKSRVRVMLLDSFISFAPKVQDKLTAVGKTYTVYKVERDVLLKEWYLDALV